MNYPLGKFIFFEHTFTKKERLHCFHTCLDDIIKCNNTHRKEKITITPTLVGRHGAVKNTFISTHPLGTLSRQWANKMTEIVVLSSRVYLSVCEFKLKLVAILLLLILL